MLPNLGEVALCRRYLMGPRSTSSLITIAICYKVSPYVGCIGPSVVVGSKFMGMLGCRAGPQLAANPCIV